MQSALCEMENRSPRVALFAFLLSTVPLACASNAPPVTPVAPRVRTEIAHRPSPEACVDPVRHAEHINGMLDEEGRPYYAPEERAFDLDDDGMPDAVLAADRDATTVRYEMYVRPNGCGRYVGGARLEGTVVGTRGVSHGLRVLEVVGRCEDACEAVPHQELRFDGIKWVLGDRWTVPRR